MTERIFRRRDVEDITGLSCATIYEWMASGNFPKPIKLGKRAVGWKASDIEAWIAEREAA